MPNEYYTALASMVMAKAPRDPQLRQKIYELARHKLRRRIEWETAEFGYAEGAQRFQALEAAIRQLETDLSGSPEPGNSVGSAAFSPISDQRVEILPPS